MVLELSALRRQHSEAVLVPIDKMTERPKDMIEAERMNRADIVVGVVSRLKMVVQPGFDLPNRRVCVGDACHSARRMADFVDNPGKFGNDNARLAAAGTRGQHQVFIAACSVLLFHRQRHGAASHSAASVRYLGMLVAWSTWRATI